MRARPSAALTHGVLLQAAVSLSSKSIKGLRSVGRRRARSGQSTSSAVASTLVPVRILNTATPGAVAAEARVPRALIPSAGVASASLPRAGVSQVHIARGSAVSTRPVRVACRAHRTAGSAAHLRCARVRVGVEQAAI